VHRHLRTGVRDADLPAANRHLDALTDQPPRYAVAVAVDRDRTIGLHPAHQLAQLAEGRSAIERRQCGCLVPPETHQRHLAGGAMHSLVGDLAHPPVEMSLQCPRVVEDHLLRHPAKALERALDTVEPGRLLLVPEGPDKRTSRVAQGRHEQMHP
jgi:hypothetical protein